MARSPWPPQRERRFEVWRDYLQLARLVAEMGRQAAPGTREVPAEAGSPGAAAAGCNFCSFCKHNGESRGVYASHRLKDPEGRVSCPILRQYTCPQCGATGDAAHTRRFCPLTRRGYTSVYSSSQRNSAGRKKRKV
uniref:nanos homolog 3 n=1 Tax=Euleptes europaea TaxID=460621 RepID=UPI00253FA930|nr:nanos homolog 3 [Euleptes europaea]